MFWRVIWTPVIAIVFVSLFQSGHVRGIALQDITHTPHQLLIGPDLVVERLTLTPANPQPGQATAITVTVKNTGDAVAPGGFFGALYIAPASPPPTTTVPNSDTFGCCLPLSPGQSFTYTQIGYAFPTSGTFRIYAMADSTGLVTETDESNNVAYAEVLVGPEPLASDGYEPDNSCTQATPIAAFGTTQLHNLSAPSQPDEDWVRFNTNSAVTYRIEALPDGADADLALALHALASDNTCPLNLTLNANTFNYTAPTSGTMFLRITHRQGHHGAGTHYRLRITSNDQCSGAFEPNNTCQAATEWAANGSLLPQAFCQYADQDWVKFPVSAGASYVVSATNVGADADAVLQLFPTCSDAATPSTGQFVRYTASSSGFAYVRAINQDPSLAGPTTQYQMQVSQQTTGCGADLLEEDDFSTAARALTLNTPQTHTICPPGDEDWATFVAAPNITYTFEALNLGDTADTVLCLFDSSAGSPLKCDDDSGPGKGSRLLWSVPTSKTLLLRVRHASASVAGPETRYDLRAMPQSCEPDAFEPDDARLAARPLTADGTPQAHTICAAGDADWVSFSVAAGSYGITATALGAEADPMLELYDAAGRRLAENDDYSPGTTAQLGYTFTAAGQYYLKAQHYNPGVYGAGTEYALKLAPGMVSQPPPQTVTIPGGNDDEGGGGAGRKTAILVNMERVQAVYPGKSASLLTKLEQLAQQAAVQGEVIRLEQNTAVKQAYATWVADSNNVDKANQVTAAIRTLIWSYAQQHADLAYVVLVGDDMLLPFRRIADATPRNDFVERTYGRLDSDNPVGAALQGNYFLSDDYYADRAPTVLGNHELYIPDLAIGRLIESPDDMMAYVNTFLRTPTTVAQNALVTGWDFVQDVGEMDCNDWRLEIGASHVNCDAIGDHWSLATLRSLQLTTTLKYDIQSINGHANHYAEQVPAGLAVLDANEIFNSAAQFEGSIIYTPGCHSGLNVPGSNSIGSLDLPEAFVRKGATYIGNTGYGWGIRGGIGLTERLMRLLTEELRRGGQVSMGQALARAKLRYFLEDSHPDAYDEKVLEQVVFYGLPMRRLQTSAVLSADDPFPDVRFSSSLPSFDPSTNIVLSSTGQIELASALAASQVLSLHTTSSGSYYALPGAKHNGIEVAANEPVQPHYFASITGPSQRPPRSVVFTGGHYERIPNFAPYIAAPVTDDMTDTHAATMTDALGWFPSAPLSLQQNNGQSRIVAQLGQFDAETQQARLFHDVQLALYFSASSDVTLPQATVVDGLFAPSQGLITLKVGATDSSGIARVLVLYDQPSPNTQTGLWRSADLHYDAPSQKWIGSFTGRSDTRFWVQIVDGAGNVQKVDNKGIYFGSGKARSGLSVFLPMVLK